MQIDEQSRFSSTENCLSLFTVNYQTEAEMFILVELSVATSETSSVVIIFYCYYLIALST